MTNEKKRFETFKKRNNAENHITIELITIELITKYLKLYFVKPIINY